jgi:hypothetical protein
MTTSFLEGDAARGRVRIRKPITMNTILTGSLQHAQCEGQSPISSACSNTTTPLVAVVLLPYGFITLLVDEHCSEVDELVGMHLLGVRTTLR